MADFGIPEQFPLRRKPGLSGLGGDQHALGPDPGSYTPPPSPPPPPVVAAGPVPRLPKSLPPAMRDTGGLADQFTKFLGFKARQGKVIPGLDKLIVTWLAPQPFGFTPPHYYGLPDDYLFGLTPQDAYDLGSAPTADLLTYRLQEPRRQAEIKAALDAIAQQQQLPTLTTPELLAQRRAIRELHGADTPPDLITAAYDREILRRIAPQLTTPGDQQTNNPTIGDRVTQGAQIGQFAWPDDLQEFIDQLTAVLPPDP